MMKKILYIIPGWKDTCHLRPYILLAEKASRKGYQVVLVNVNWKQPLSGQILPMSRDAVIFGFSLGAILGWLIAQKYQCKHLILASMTPIKSFTNKKMKKELSDVVGSNFVNDVAKVLKPSTKSMRITTIYGDRENEPADIIIRNTGHRLSEKYINRIFTLL